MAADAVVATAAAGEGSVDHTGEYREEHMEVAFEEAALAKEEDEVPIGCAFVKDGVVVARGRNRTNRDANGCAHAEVVAANALKAKDPAHSRETLRGSLLYVTVEPCVMCASALLFLEVRAVFYGCGNQRFGGCGGVLNIDKQNPFYTLPCYPGYHKDRAIALLRTFYESENLNCPEHKRRKKLQ